MPLSAVAVKNAKPRDAQYRLADERGLYLLVRPNGARWWRFDYRFAGTRKTLSLGVFPEVDLATARTKRDRAREQVAAGIDPSEARRAVPDAARTFEQVAREWHESKRSKWNDTHAATVMNRLARNIFPAFGELPIGEVSAAHVLEAIRVIENRGAVPAARRIKNYVADIFGYAGAAGYVETDPTAGLNRVLKTPARHKSRAAIRAPDVQPFLVALAASNEQLATRQAMLLTVLTVVRTVETRFAAWHEFEALNGPAPLWRIPPERMKMKQEHLVPLSRQVVQLVREIRRTSAGEGLLFARPTRSGTLSENTMLYGLYRLGYHSRATMHGFRASFSTWANEAGYNSDWIERQLAHVEGNAVRAAYNAAEYLPGRRAMLQAWADFVAPPIDEFDALLMG